MTVVRVMREVKDREEEYKFVKTLLSNVRGLPRSINLANRERRLIAHGSLQRILIRKREKKIEHNKSFTNGPSAWREVEKSLQRRRSRQSMFKLRRVNSLDSCLASDLSESSSMQSLTSISSLTSSEDLDRYRFEDAYGIEASNRGHFSHGPLNNDRQMHSGTRSKIIYAFIFNDLAVFTRPLGQQMQRRASQSHECWELINDIGICRILSMNTCSGEFGTLFRVSKMCFQ